MSNLPLEQLVVKYQDFRKKLKAYRFADYLIGWDSETEAPSGCFDERSQMVGILSSESFKLMTCSDTVNLVNELYERKSELTPLLALEIKKYKKELDQILNIPLTEYVKYNTLLASSQQKWAIAKNKSDFTLFRDTLKEIIAYQKKLMKYYETDELKGYDTLLDIYEEGITEKDYDAFFDVLKRDLVPFVLEVSSRKSPAKKSLINKKFKEEKQEILSHYFLDVLKFDWQRGVLKKSEHPFTSGFGSTDVRVTTHYYEDNVYSNIFSVIHEGGHATYELQCDQTLDETFLGGGATMAMHESQSRLYENMIGRSRAFWEAHFDKLKTTFPSQMKDITIDDVYYDVNRVERSLIRTEADELTYPIHIMLRYDLEKMLLEGNLAVDDLPKKWNELMMSYLGIEIPNDKNGVLQDIHWAMGSFGYFPTYAYGSAIAAQLYYYMNKEFDVAESLRKKTTADVNEWLKEHVHKYGKTLSPNEMLIKATGEAFNPKYYIDYLKNKYSKIYNIN